ncbi:hypothetical protein [Aquella oligotrophica]|uniref:Uncharacterized protein n=1 Tax=Aquella oligotrophica TaxID=2067065 RepID=A0A2I7N6H6_9NEIS|nr:hypothetical protein [Aquella oligotrophica]AUR52073.1 hypothetical protein CUN60_07090 [Aquella oligotrophica]
MMFQTVLVNISLVFLIIMLIVLIKDTFFSKNYNNLQNYCNELEMELYELRIKYEETQAIAHGYVDMCNRLTWQTTCDNRK